jgi:hypothetical protein
VSWTGLRLLVGSKSHQERDGEREKIVEHCLNLHEFGSTCIMLRLWSFDLFQRELKWSIPDISLNTPPQPRFDFDQP